jgi:hypothetical protein
MSTGDVMIPKHVTEDPNFRFGRSSGAYDEDAQRIAGIINYDYLKEHLTESITKKALESITKSQIVKKDWRNKGYNLRSQSVAKKIDAKKREELIET